MPPKNSKPFSFPCVDDFFTLTFTMDIDGSFLRLDRFHKSVDAYLDGSEIRDGKVSGRKPYLAYMQLLVKVFVAWELCTQVDNNVYALTWMHLFNVSWRW